ncbi:MAG TPA: hypothetical protein VIM31_02350 [Candidatus Microsaccharimonas sp.]|jgi:hypothetical protein
MEGIEGSFTRPVHVLRHRFDATEQLAEQVSLLLERQAREQKLRFFATKLAVLDGSNYYNFRYDEIVTKVSESFERRTAAIALNGRVNFRSIQNDRVRIGFQPDKQSEFNALLSGFNLLDTLRPEPRVLNHYIYTDVPRSMILQSPDDRETAVGGFKKAVAYSHLKRLHTLQPLEVTGYDHTIAFSKQDEQIARIARRTEPWEDQDVAS